MIEAILAGVEKILDALGPAIGIYTLDAVLAAGLAGVAFAGLNDSVVVGAQVVPVLATGAGNLQGCHGECGEMIGGFRRLAPVAGTLAGAWRQRGHTVNLLGMMSE